MMGAVSSDCSGTARVLCAVLITTLYERCDHTRERERGGREWLQRRFTGMLPGLERLISEERLVRLKLFS